MRTDQLRDHEARLIEDLRCFTTAQVRALCEAIALIAAKNSRQSKNLNVIPIRQKEDG